MLILNVRIVTCDRKKASFHNYVPSTVAGLGDSMASHKDAVPASGANSMVGIHTCLTTTQIIRSHDLL